MASCRSSASRPRDAIGSLCHLMNVRGISGLTPELFRQAKFNKPEAVAPLWSLLSTLVHFSAHRCVPPKSHQAAESPSRVKHAMLAGGYRCRRFHRLPDDMSRGSRELLLACGWLLAKKGLLRHLMMDGGAHADTAHLHLEEVRREGRGREGLRGSGETSMEGDRGLSSGAKYLAWLTGRCAMEMRRLYIRQHELCNLSHQIHQATLGVSMTGDSPHLSLLETFILRNPGQLQKYQQTLEAEQSRLHICIKWQEQQATFWQWIESVIDANLQDISDGVPDPDDCNSSSLEHLTESLAHPLSALEGHIQQLEHLVRDNLEDDDLENEDSPELNRIRLTVEKDISARLVPVATAQTHRSPPREDSYQTSRFHLIKERQRPAVAKTTHGKPADVGDVREEIVRLSAVVERLQRELEDVRRDHCSRINAFTSLLPDAVCIPPMGSAR